ncbi:MAG: rod shape-determining protein MreC [Candidatus Paceibacterota bacterium]
MKTNYLKRNRRTHIARLRITLGLVILVLFVVATFVIPMPSFISRIGLAIATPALVVGKYVSDASSEGLALLQSKRALIAENRRLDQELRQVSIKLLDRNLLKEENLAIKDALGRSSYEKLVYAPVLTKPSRSPYDVLILDGGYLDGISVDDQVLSSESSIIGKIVESGRHVSRARLFSTSGVATPVVIAPLNIETEAIGRGNGNFEIKISRDLEVEIGDEIQVPGLSPKLFGIVEDIYVSPTDSLQTLLFKSPVNMAELGFVFIVTEEDEESEL